MYSHRTEGIWMDDFPRPWIKYYDPSKTTPDINYPRTSTYELVRGAAERLPDNIACEFENKETTYAEFIKKVDHVAACLQAMGVKKGDKILVCMPNCPQAIQLFYASSKCGAICVLIHPLSAKKEIEYYLNNSGSKIAFTLDGFTNNFIAVKDDVPKLEKVVITSIKDELSFIKSIGYSLTLGRKVPKYPKKDYMMGWKQFLNLARTEDYVDVEVKGEDPACILYSGGTTSVSKGILISNDNLNFTSYGTLAISNCFPCFIEDMCTDKATELIKKRDYIILSVMPIFHGFGLGVGIHSFLIFGGKCVLVPTFTPESYAKLIKEKHPNFIAGVPTLFEKMIGLDIMADADMSSLEGIFCGGDSLPESTRKKFNEFLATHNGKTVIREGYGLTECVTASCITPVNEYHEGGIGIPFPNVLFKIVKYGTEEEVPYGEEGEICMSGPNVMMGYVGDPELTAKTLRVHSDGRTWLHTGDAGSIDSDGFVYFKQRYKRIIVSSGYNIYPSQIEDAVNKYPGVKTSCAIGVPDPVRQQRVKVYVVLNPGVEGNEELKQKLIAHCREYIAAYAVPKLFEFIDELPHTKVGKIAYKELEEYDRKMREEGSN